MAGLQCHGHKHFSDDYFAKQNNHPKNAVKIGVD